MAKENIYEIECGDDDELFAFVYDFEPYDRGSRDEPPSGGNAFIYEIRDSKGVKIPDRDWVTRGFDEKAIRKLEEDAYNAHCEREKDAYDSAMESKADAERERE